jgi:hypothetical protein
MAGITVIMLGGDGPTIIVDDPEIEVGAPPPPDALLSLRALGALREVCALDREHGRPDLAPLERELSKQTRERLRETFGVADRPIAILDFGHGVLLTPTEEEEERPPRPFPGGPIQEQELLAE